MKYIIIIICFNCWPFFMSAQQISSYLYNAIPKEHRPADRRQLTLPELGDLMVNAKWHVINNEKAIKELDSLCIYFAPKYRTIADKRKRVQFLFDLDSYWVGRVDTFLDSMLKYSLLFDAEAQNSIDGFEDMAGLVALKEAIVYTGRTREHKKAYDCSIKALSIFHRINDSAGIYKSFMQLTGIYTALGLYRQAGSYLDSSNLFNTGAKHSRTVDYRFSYGSELFLRQYAETKENRFADSLNNMIKVCNDSITFPESTQNFFQNSLFLAKSQLHYYQKNYQQSLLDIDLAYKVMGVAPMASYDDISLRAFKGLDLLQLGKEKEGIAILESVEPNMDYYYTGMMLTEIYNYEKKKGNLAKALQYHEKMMAFNANEQQLKHQGQLLEMDKQYNVAARDLQISMLKAQQDKTKYIVVLISLFAMALIGFVFMRQRNSKRKTQQLLDQIEDLTQMQIVRIEAAAQQAEENERKRIGQELHDDLSASLAGVLHFMRTKTGNEKDPQEKSDMLKACALLESSYAKTRLKSHDIYHRETDGQFVAMLTDNVNLFFTGTGIKVNAEIDHVGMAELSVNIKTNILLILKEAIANVIKHAKASKVNILLYNSNGNINIEVEDDGIGFAKGGVNGKSRGLQSIKERIEKINGKFDLESKTNEGTLLKMILPAN